MIFHESRAFCFYQGFSLRFRQRVLEVIRVFSRVDLDIHRSRQFLQLPSTGRRDNRDAQLQRARLHCAAVLQDEAAVAAFQRSRY